MRAPVEMAKAVRSLAHRHSTHHVFSDFVEMSALSLSNAIDKKQYEQREKRYMEIVPRYKKDELETFPKLLAMLVEGLEESPSDILGALFHELELHNTYKGQFFSPYHLCKMMAKMNIGDGVKETVKERGFITAQEPACGSGAMVIALADEMKQQEINYQQALHVTAIDIDIRCVHMAYVQMSLLHIPAVIVHGNALSLEEWGHWYTPAHIMGGWDFKLKRARIKEKELMESVLPIPSTETKEEAPAPLPQNACQLKLF